MLHTLLHLYNLASPRTKRAARAGAAFLAGAAIAVLATACSPAYAQPVSRGKIRTKPRGPVLENTNSSEVAAPTFKRGFVSSKFSRCRHSGIGVVSGGMGLPVRMAARLSSCFQHPAHQMRLKTQTVALLSRSGAKTMHPATTTASAAARTPIQTAPSTSEAQAFALLQATSDATMAKLYLSKGNIPAARRKAVQLLKALQSLEVTA